MTKSKNQPKLNKVVLNNVDAVVVGVKPAANNDVPKEDLRHNNPGRPVNKKSARYKRLAKQAFYASVNSKFKKGNQFKVKSETYVYKPCANDSGTLGSIVSTVTGHVCNVSYIGRTKVQGYTFVLDKQVKIELNLKTLQFVK